MTPRSAQILTAALAGLLVVLLGATVFVLLSRPGPGPTPSPSPTLPSFALPSPTTVAIVSPSLPPTLAPATATPAPTPTVFASAAASAFPTPSPSPSPTASPSPSPTPVPTPTPTPVPTPTIVPTAPDRSFQLLGIGVDMACGNSTDCTSVPRFISFNTDGPSLITATVSNTSAAVRVCLRMEPQLQGTCNTGKNATVQAFTLDAGSDTWTVSLIGKDSAATASVAIQFNANQPNATLDSFRWAGTSSPNYNGFDAVVGALADGQIQLHAAFDDGGQGAYNSHVVISEVSGDTLLDQTSGATAPTVDVTQPVTKGNYRITFSDPDSVANPGAAVFVTTTIAWP